MDDPLGSLGLNFGSIQGGLYDVAYYIIWGVLILGVGFYIWKKYQDKKIYKYPIRIFRRRQNGLIKEFNTFGGYIVKQGQTIFSIKMSKFKKKELPRLPDSELMDEEDRIYYYQLSPESPLVQCKRSFVIEQVFVANEKYIEPTPQEKENLLNRYILEISQEEEMSDKTSDEIKLMALQRLESEIEDEKLKEQNVTNVHYTPVPTDQKLQAYYDIRKLSQTLGVDVNKQFAYFIIGVVAIIIIGAFIFYLAINKGDIPILTK